jgi:hypothetical protein
MDTAISNDFICIDGKQRIKLTSMTQLLVMTLPWIQLLVMTLP